jgi:hypothetical protein
MSYSQWANFVYYNLGDIATFNSINYEALLPNINVVPTGLAPHWQVLPAGVGAGVSSLETLTGAITMSCSSGTYTTAGNDINLAIVIPVPTPFLSDGIVEIHTGVVDVLVETGIFLGATPQITLTFFNDGVVPPNNPYNGNPVAGENVWYDRELQPVAPTATQFYIRISSGPPPPTYYKIAWILFKV